MARTTDSTQAPSADAFLNLKITDKQGTVWSFKTGIALHKSRKLDAKIIQDSELFNKLLKSGSVTASVHIIGADSGNEPDFS